jgi:hypothetical protein
VHVNIWSKELPKKKVEVFHDCTFMHCGNLVQVKSTTRPTIENTNIANLK